MTSANVTNYRIDDLTGKTVGELSQHVYCKTKWGELLQYTPPENYTITAYGEDEDEESWENDPVSLKTFIDKLKANRAQFNTWADIKKGMKR